MYTQMCYVKDSRCIYSSLLQKYVHSERKLSNLDFNMCESEIKMNVPERYFKDECKQFAYELKHLRKICTYLASLFSIIGCFYL